MANQGTVGANKQGGLSVNTPADERLDQSGALVTTDGHARYQESLYTGNVFSAANTGAAVTIGIVATMSTSVTGYCLFNPNSSGKNMVLIDVCIALAAAPAGASPLGLFYNTSATALSGLTSLTVRNALLPGTGTNTATPSIGIGQAASAATVPTQGVPVRYISGGILGASALTPAMLSDFTDGKLILGPGSYIYPAAVITTASTGMVSMTWEEVKL